MQIHQPLERQHDDTRHLAAGAVAAHGAFADVELARGFALPQPQAPNQLPHLIRLGGLSVRPLFRLRFRFLNCIHDCSPLVHRPLSKKRRDHRERAPSVSHQPPEGLTLTDDGGGSSGGALSKLVANVVAPYSDKVVVNGNTYYWALTAVDTGVRITALRVGVLEDPDAARA